MRAFLVLFLVDRVHRFRWSDGKALSVYGWYTGWSSSAPWLAAGWRSVPRQRRAVVIGGTLMMAGQFSAR
jgi:dipeptide/tripeptide permease